MLKGAHAKRCPDDVFGLLVKAFRHAVALVVLPGILDSFAVLIDAVGSLSDGWAVAYGVLFQPCSEIGAFVIELCGL